MKIKDVIKLLEQYNPEAEIIDFGEVQDMSARIPYICEDLEVRLITPVLETDIFQIKFINARFGESINDFIKHKNG